MYDYIMQIALDIRVGVICNSNIKIISNLPFFNVIASNRLLCGLTITVIGTVLKVIVILYNFLLHLLHFFENHLNPVMLVYIGKSIEFSHMSSHLQGLQLFFRFLLHFVLASNSIRVTIKALLKGP